MRKSVKSLSTKSKKVGHLTAKLLFLYRHDRRTATELAKHLGVSRTTVYNHQKKLLSLGMIYQFKNSPFYLPTKTGSTFLDTYDKSDKKRQPAIENYRYRCRIRNDKLLQQFIFEYNLKHYEMNNWYGYVGKIEGFVIWINQGKKITMQIGHPKEYSNDIIGRVIEANNSVSDLVYNLSKKWKFNCTPVQRIKKGSQLSFPDPFAEDLMSKSGGSQIKFGENRFTFDQSNKTEGRLEFNEIFDAEEYIKMPKVIGVMDKKLDMIGNSMNKITDNMSVMATNIEKFTNLMTTALGVDEHGDKPKPKDLNFDSKKMFG